MIDTIDQKFSILSSNSETRSYTVSHLRAFLTWVDATYGVSMTAADMLKAIVDYAAVQNFIDAQQGKKAQSTLREMFLTLNRISADTITATNAEGVEPGRRRGSWERETRDFGSQAPSPGYSPAELIRINDWIGSRPTEYSRQSAEIIVALALGAGLATTEILHLTYDDITVRSDHVLVRAPGARGVVPRTVPVTVGWGTRLLEVLRQCPAPTTGGDYLVLRHRRRTTTGQPSLALSAFITKTTAKSPGGLKPVVGRMRTTWFLEHVRNRVPFDMLWAAAGFYPATERYQRKRILSAGLMTRHGYDNWRSASDPDYLPLTSI